MHRSRSPTACCWAGVTDHSRRCWVEALERLISTSPTTHCDLCGRTRTNDPAGFRLGSIGTMRRLHPFRLNNASFHLDNDRYRVRQPSERPWSLGVSPIRPALLESVVTADRICPVPHRRTASHPGLDGSDEATVASEDATTRVPLDGGFVGVCVAQKKSG